MGRKAVMNGLVDGAGHWSERAAAEVLGAPKG
jgi:hypothetical protein